MQSGLSIPEAKAKEKEAQEEQNAAIGKVFLEPLEVDIEDSKRDGDRVLRLFPHLVGEEQKGFLEKLSRESKNALNLRRPLSKEQHRKMLKLARCARTKEVRDYFEKLENKQSLDKASRLNATLPVIKRKTDSSYSRMRKKLYEEAFVTFSQSMSADLVEEQKEKPKRPSMTRCVQDDLKEAEPATSSFTQYSEEKQVAMTMCRFNEAIPYTHDSLSSHPLYSKFLPEHWHGGSDFAHITIFYRSITEYQFYYPSSLCKKVLGEKEVYFAPDLYSVQKLGGAYYGAYGVPMIDCKAPGVTAEKGYTTATMLENRVFDKVRGLYPRGNLMGNGAWAFKTSTYTPFFLFGVGRISGKVPVPGGDLEQYNGTCPVKLQRS